MDLCGVATTDAVCRPSPLTSLVDSNRRYAGDLPYAYVDWRNDALARVEPLLRALVEFILAAATLQKNVKKEEVWMPSVAEQRNFVAGPRSTENRLHEVTTKNFSQ